MNILTLSHFDWSGASYALAQAINNNTEHECRQVIFDETYIKYPYDITKPDEEQLARLIDWADVINLNDNLQIGRVRKPTIMTYHGSWYRRNWQEANEFDKSRGRYQTCLTIDLSQYGPRWIGRPMADMSKQWKPDKRTFRVCHAPTKRHQKGSDDIEAALKDVDGVTLEVIENVTNKECLKRKAKASVYVDQVGGAAIGHGTNSLEAWALGMPVISGAPDNIFDLIESIVGYVPFIRVETTDQLAAAVTRLKDDSDYYAYWRDVGRQYVKEWHGPAFVAELFVKVCERIPR